MDFTKIASEIAQNIGGENNVSSLSHCMTRLRFVLKDDKLADLTALKSIDGVLGAVFGAGQLQIIMGKNLMSVYEALMTNYDFLSASTETKVVGEKNHETSK